MAATYITVTNATSNQLSLVGDNGKPRIDIPAVGGSNSVTINITDLLGNSLLCTTLATWTTSSKITSTRGSVTLTAADFTAWAQGSDMNRSDYDADDDTIVDTAESIQVNNPTAVAAAASPYTVLAADTVLLVDTTAGAVEVDLPAVASSSGRTIVVKDEGGNAATNAITIDPNGAETLDGSATSATINTNFGFMSLFCDGTQWLSNAKSKAHDAEVLEMTGTAVAFGASPYTVLVTDTLILADTALGAVELDLPAVASNAGRTIMVVDEGGNAATNRITIDPSGAETLDGSATSAQINENYGHLCLYCDGTQWLSWSGSRALSVWDATTEVTGAAVVQSVANFAGSITAVNNAASPYAALATDEVIATDATAGVIAITLPPPVARKTIKIIDTTGTISATNTVTVSQNAAETIDGATSIVLDTAYESLTLISDGTNWFTFEAISRLNEDAGVHVATRAVGIADLTAAAGNQSFDFASALPADAWILGSYIDVTEAFTDGAAGTFTADLGESGGDTDALIDGADITTAIAKVGTPIGTLNTGFTYAGATLAIDIIGTVNVDTATAGALTVKVAYISMDSLLSIL